MVYYKYVRLKISKINKNKYNKNVSKMTVTKENKKNAEI